MGQGNQSVKLNLGCGKCLLDGFINVDLAGNWSKVPPDIIADVSKPLPFDTNYADEVHAYHVLEHMYRWKVPGILREWVRVLKPEGKLIIEVPCFDKVMDYIFACIQQKISINPRMSYWALYGDPNYKDEAMCHHWCFGTVELNELFVEAGLIDIELLEPQTHIKARDIRIEGTKP